MVYKKPLKYNPDDFSEEAIQHFFDYEYQDRGMLKWQGFFLSDHTSALNQEKDQPAAELLPRQSADEISSRLFQSWQSRRPVTIQMQEIDGDQVPQEFRGVVVGYYENEVGLKLAESEKTLQLLLEEIRNVNIGQKR
ncbi:hypothetical protein LFYK43_06470 [Ligilactobacillus salitolerans]|uniref:DNA-directed RNA polymerase beta subunit n=1 Tax=Ligilactobacillus salitolerans TaxID=1808352 RepID=A0A401IRN2_9LACO|nr:hypothetical protein [Ligilactobacillus salitolerans]GBG94188.1 hypothetical protein LFYK43_06470 [Ligilactobacillus salitolerans]